VGSLPLGPASVRGLVIELERGLPAPALLQYALANLTLKARAGKESLQVVFTFPAGFVQAHTDLIAKLGAYTDALGTVFAPGWEAEVAKAAELALNKPVFLKLEGETPAEQVASRYLDAVMAASGTSVDVIWTEQSGAHLVAPLCKTANFMAGVLTKDFSPMAAALAPFAVTSGGVETGPQKLFADGRTPNVAMLAKPGASSANPKTLDMRGSAGEQFEMEWYDPIAGARLIPGKSVPSGGSVAQSCVAQSSYVFLLMRKSGTAEQRVYSEVQVSDRADLKVEEVIARWQRYKEAQRQALDSYTSACFTNLHFQPTNMGSGFDVSMRIKQYAKRDTPTEWVQTDFYVNGVRFKQANFPLPQLEPEKVVTQPLDLKVNEKYSYHLAGTEQMNGVQAYVVAVDPIGQNENLYSGRIWIDTKTFRQVRMDLRQRSAKSNVISNQETQNFALAPDGKGREYNLLKSIYAQQTLNAAGRDFILEKTYTYSDYAINVENFDSELAAARKSDKPMYRDTEAGLRTLRNEHGERVEQPAGQKRIKSIVSGVLYDGSFTYPIPLFGYSLVDFNYHGSQLSMFFAGPILAANISKQVNSRFRVGLDMALNGLPGNERVYDGNKEVLSRGLWSWEETSGLRMTWQPTAGLSFTAAGYVAYNYFRRTSDTDKNFMLPRNGISLLPTAEFKYAKKGFIFTGKATQGHRLGWKQFGLPEAPDSPLRKNYLTYSGDFNKNFYLSKFTKSGVSLAYYSGEHLDRFSRYRPSFFASPRLRGIPSGTDSFDTVAVAGVSHGFNVADLIKFEGSYNHAWGRNRIENSTFKAYDGLDFEMGTAGPWGTYLQGIFTYALKGNLERYNSRFGAYLLIFKPLK